MPKFRKKPVVIEAVKWNGDNLIECLRFCPTLYQPEHPTNVDLIIPTLEGNMRAKVGDWIIRGVKGEFYPCAPDIFEKTYDSVEGE